MDTPFRSANQMLNQSIRTRAGEDLGRIEDILIEPATSSPAYLMLSIGGTFGLGARYHAVPWSAVRADPDGTLRMDLDREDFEEAPSIERDDWPGGATPDWLEGVDSWWQSRAGERVPPAAGPIGDRTRAGERTPAGDRIPPRRTKNDFRRGTEFTGTDPKIHPPQS